MRFAHISDLHLGKRLGSYTLIEDQRYILSQIADIASAEKCDGILIAGDIYDKSAPSAEAVRLFGEFLTKLRRNKLSV
ncbi:MAG: exonuclease subunit SbcD, partial [Ruminococcus sp.]|uniref:metallophosphoesterase family protein n=1 Tax=Ruminococcus sp. TaxID=41978 RepID=UPI0025F9365F